MQSEVPYCIVYSLHYIQEDSSVTLSRRKSLESPTYRQQRTRLAAVVSCIRASAEAENTPPSTIAAISLQLLSNEVDDRKAAIVAKKKAFDGAFGNLVNSQISLEVFVSP